MPIEEPFPSLVWDLTELFGQGASFGPTLRLGDSFRLRVAWSWPSAERPKRKSRIIELIVRDGTLEKFRALDPETRGGATLLIDEALRELISGFKKEWDGPPDSAPPTEYWEITADFGIILQHERCDYPN